MTTLIFCLALDSTVSRNKTTRNSLISGGAEAAVNSAKLFRLHISIADLAGLTDDLGEGQRDREYLPRVSDGSSSVNLLISPFANSNG